MGVTFDMGDTTLSTLSRQTGGHVQSLGALVKQMVVAAQPLEGKMNGAGKKMFDAFKAHSDQIAADLNRGLGSVHTGQMLMDKHFGTGVQTMADNARSNMGGANFDAARFHG